MAEYGIITKDNFQARKFFQGLVERLKNPDVKRNPYTSSMETVKVEQELFTRIKLESVYPPLENLSFFTVMLMLIVKLFGWANWLVLVFGIATLIFSIYGLVKTDRFNFWVMRHSLIKKYNYTGEVRFVKRKIIQGWNFDTEQNLRVFTKRENNWQ